MTHWHFLECQAEINLDPLGYTSNPCGSIESPGGDRLAAIPRVQKPTIDFPAIKRSPKN